MPTNVTQQQLELLKQAYLATGNVTQAAKEADIPRTGAYYHLGQMGITFDRTPPLREMAELHASGMSYRQMAEHFRVSPGTIHNWMALAGLTKSGKTQ